MSDAHDGQGKVTFAIHLDTQTDEISKKLLNKTTHFIINQGNNSDFKASVIVAATWSKMKPYPYEYYGNTEMVSIILIRGCRLTEGGFPRDELFSEFAANTRRKFRCSEVFRRESLLGKCFFFISTLKRILAPLSPERSCNTITESKRHVHCFLHP